MRRATLGLALALAGLAALPTGSLAAGVGRQEAIAAADREPKVVEKREQDPRLRPTASLVNGDWQVDYFSGGEDKVQVVVDDTTGVVRESWTGDQVAWTMARGYPGAFGHKLNAPYVWLPLCALFLIGLLDWRRPLRVANLDLLVLLSFGASQFFFNRGEIGLSAPLAYPPLLYLLARMLWIGFRGRGEGLRPMWPAAWLLIAALFLLGFRAGLNIADSGVIDVGYAGVVGADRVADGEPIYGEGNFPQDVGSGDTYGPVNYFAYVPFEQALPWSGTWDELPAAHAAAIFFDLATFVCLLALGMRLRPGAEGRRLGAMLGFAWAAYPYTAFVLSSNANDTLVALLLTITLLLLARPAARGAAIALAGLTKFSPLILAPLLATYTHDAPSTGGAADADPAPRGLWSRGRITSAVTGPVARRFGVGFIAVALVVMGWTIVAPGLSTFWDRTIASQIDRDSPFSIWGQAPSLEPLRVALIAALGLLAALVAWRPRRKSVTQVAALGAALLIGTQLIAQHWFYLYLVWFLPFLLAALGTVSPRPAPGPALSTRRGRWGRSPRQPPSPTHPPPRSRSEPASA